MIEKRAVYKISSGLIINTIVVDTTKPPSLTEGLALLTITQSVSASIGDTWDGNQIVKGVATPPQIWVGAKITQGNYLGDNTKNRAIAHKLEDIPKIIWLQTGTGKVFISICATASITPTSETTGPAIKAADKTNFYVGNALNLPGSANEAGYTYYWVAVA